MIVRELFTRLGMKTDAASFKRADKSLERVKKAAAAIAGIFVARRVVTGFRSLIFETTAAADSVAKTSQKLGVGAQALQEYQYAAQLSGVQVRTFNMGLQRFARRTAEAAKGTGEAKDALNQMGIQLRDSEGRLRPADDLLLDVADSISKVSDEGEKVRLAFKLFDSEGVALINMLKGGGDALMAMRKEARETGGVFSEQFIAASVKMTDQLLRLKMSMIGMKVTIANALLPAINAVVEWLMRISKGVRAVLKDTALLEVAFGILTAAATVLAFVLGFKLFGAIGSLAVSLVGLTGGFTAAGAAALLMKVKMALIGAAFILLAGIILAAAEEIFGALTGMDTLGQDISDTLSDLYDAFMKAGKKSPWLEALLIPLKAMATFLVRSKDALFALIMFLQNPGDVSGFRVLAEDAKKDLEGIWDLNKRLGAPVEAGAAGLWEMQRRMGAMLEGAIGVGPTPQAVPAGAITSSSQVTIHQTIQGTSDPAATAKMAGEDIRQVIREENAKTLRSLTPAKAVIP